MNESQLMQTFSCLTLKDRRALRQFVRSPFHNTREDVVQLFDYLDNNWDNPKRNFTKEAVWNELKIKNSKLKATESGVRETLKVSRTSAKSAKNAKNAKNTEGVLTLIDGVIPNHPVNITTLFDAKKLNYTLSFLDNLIHKYLIINQLENETAEQNLLLEKAFLLRGSDKLAEKTWATARQQFDGQPMQNAAAHFHDFRLHRGHYDRASRRDRSDDAGLQAAADAFTDFTVAETLRTACSMLTQQAFSKRTYQLPLLDAVLRFVESKIEKALLEKGENSEENEGKLNVREVFEASRTSESLKNAQNTEGVVSELKIKNDALNERKPLKFEIKNLKSAESIAVLAYFHAYQSLSKDDDTASQYVHFQQLKAILENNWQQFPADEMHGLYLMAINFCIKKMNRGEPTYGREVLEIYKIGLLNRLLFENNQLSPYTYKNAMMAALKVGEMAWANQFLNDYKVFLPSNDCEMVYKYNKALYFFRNNDYEAAMTLLQTAHLRDVLFNLDARRLLARIYFELKENTALDSLIESSKIYLHRQKTIGYHREMYINFFKILEILLKTDPKRRKILKGQIEDTQYLAEREWLLEKL